jgi:hypothetical protein
MSSGVVRAQAAMLRAPVELIRGAVADVRELRHRSPAKAESPALPALGPSASQLNDFRELLVARIQGGATPEQAGAVRDLLTRMQAHPQSRQILSALQAYHQMRGEAPSIQLMDGSDPMQLPPMLDWSIRGPVWNLNIRALDAAPPEQAVWELAAVYNNLTGMLQDADPYGQLPVNRPPPLPNELEEAWRQWAQGDGIRYVFTSQLCRVPSIRQKAIDQLRSQLRDTMYYGGVSRATLGELLQGPMNDRPVGLKVELRGLGLKAIPPLPTDVRILDIADNPIED